MGKKQIIKPGQKEWDMVYILHLVTCEAKDIFEMRVNETVPDPRNDQEKITLVHYQLVVLLLAIGKMLRDAETQFGRNFQQAQMDFINQVHNLFNLNIKATASELTNEQKLGNARPTFEMQDKVFVVNLIYAPLKHQLEIRIDTEDGAPIDTAEKKEKVLDKIINVLAIALSQWMNVVREQKLLKSGDTESIKRFVQKAFDEYAIRQTSPLALPDQSELKF